MTRSPSDRSFGALLVLLSAAVAVWSWWRGSPVHPYAFALAMVLLVVTLTRPGWLASLNRAWMAFGNVPHRLVSPLVLGVIFSGLFTAVACIMRVIKRDALKRSFESKAASYWVPRQPPGPDPRDLPNQF